MRLNQWLRSNAARLAALPLLLALFGFSRLPQLTPDERVQLVSEFAFEHELLPEIDDRERRLIRPVHPSIKHIEAWVSSTGAAVALADLDGDGLPNDLCSVDPRVNRVVVAPAPGTGERYSLFTLDEGELTFTDEWMAPVGCVPGDLNEDGLNDLLVYYWGRGPVAFLRRGGEAFADLATTAFRPQDVMPKDVIWNTNALTRADVDGDGHQDIVLANYFRDDEAVFDAKGTGEVEMQDSMSKAFNAGSKHVLRWVGGTGGAEPTVAFEDVPNLFNQVEGGGWTLAVGAADLDGDLLPELFFANDFGPDRLFHNRSTAGKVELALATGERIARAPKSKVLGMDSFKGMGVDIADVNNDGYFDIYVSNIAQKYSLHESHHMFVNTGRLEDFDRGVAPFHDHSEDYGLSRSAFSWDAKMADFNNDGVPEAMQATGFVRGDVNRWPELQELAMGNDERIQYPQSWPRFALGDDLSGKVHNPFFVRSSSGRYFDLAAEVGLDRVQVSRGFAIADVEGDGDLDFAVANQWDSSYFHRNVRKADTAFLGLTVLHSVNAARESTQIRSGHPSAADQAFAAVGATASLTLPDGRRLTAQADGGNGHSGVRSPQLHFGLGELPAGTELPVELAWRDRNGKVHRETHTFRSGWHTVLLGSS
ncbi:MAG: CRTAC1 family protein [Acidobacteriota bacterium]